MAEAEPARLPIRSPETLGQEMARRRVAADLTQDELAEAIGVSRRYIYNIESGQPNLYARRLFDSLRELGLHVELVPKPPACGGPPTPTPPPGGQHAHPSRPHTHAHWRRHYRAIS